MPKARFSTVVRKRLDDVLPDGHSALECGVAPAEQARAEHQVGLAVEDGLDHGRDASGIVLVVGVEHDDHIRALSQRFDVAGLLVAAIAFVLEMHYHFETKLASDLGRVVLAGVINEDHPVNDLDWDVAVRLFDSLGGVISGHDHDYGRLFGGHRRWVSPGPGLLACVLR